MKLDNWLAQRAQSCPERTALVAEASRSTYAELEAEATWVARRLAAHGVRRGATAALTMHPRREQVVLIHALMKLGAVVLPLSPQLTEAERAAVLAAERPAVDLNDAGQLTQTEADLPLLGEHDMDESTAASSPAAHRDARARSSSPTATTSGAPSAPRSTSASSPTTAGSAAFRSAMSRASRSSCARRSTARPRSFTTASTPTASPPPSSATGSRSSRWSRRCWCGCSTPAPTSRGPRAILVGGGPVPSDALEEALGKGATVVQTYGLTEACSQVTTLCPGRRPAQARLGRPAAADDPSADQRRRDPRPGPHRRARLRRRRRLAAHRRPRPDRRRGLPLRRGSDRRHDRHRRRERRPGGGRAGAAAPPGRRRCRGRRPRGPGVAAGGRPPWSSSRRRRPHAPTSCAAIALDRLPPSRCRSASSSPPRFPATPRASCCGAAPSLASPA